MAVDPIALLSASVVFLFASPSELPIGTGFVVGVPAPERPGEVFPCIVTAKHVVAGQTAITARFNAKAGKVQPRPVFDLRALNAAGDLWSHPDPGVDVIAFRTPHFDDADYTPIPFDLLVTPELLKTEQIRPADRVLFPSLLVNFMGLAKNFPTIRDGSIALIPDEKVPLEIRYGTAMVRTSQEVMLLNAVSVPGASGSPVFLSPGARNVGNSLVPGGTPFLLGIMHGFYPALPRETLEVQATDTKHFFQENSGIAIMFPAWRLREILSSGAVVKRLKALLATAP